MTSSSTNFIRHIFEDPSCDRPDHSHPGAHAAANLGAVLVRNGMRLAYARGVNPEVAVGVVALWLLVAAERDPAWAKAIVNSVRGGDDYTEEAEINNAVSCFLESFPLSPLDKMEIPNG